MTRFNLDKSFIRNYFLFAVILIGSAAGLLTLMVMNTQEFNELFIRVIDAFNHDRFDTAQSYLNALQHSVNRYSLILLVGLLVSTALVLILNAVLLSAQRSRGIAEASLKNSEERFALAVNGTQDGIFDWDIETKNAFFSKQYFKMLGYDRPTEGKIHDFLELVHPEDRERVWMYKENYISGKISEYEQDYRMLHANGSALWIKARATGIFDAKTGKATRLVGAHTDITAAKQIEHKLAEEVEVAEESNRAKSEFLAHMSHEIRTPLAAISGAADILSMQQADFNEKQQQLIHVMQTSSSSLKDLINSILDFSKIESSGLELDEHAFALDRVFQETISMMALRANEKGVNFKVDSNAIEGLEFWGDSTRIRQILVNIIGNAIKFTDKGSVTVNISRKSVGGFDYIQIVVKDTGIGIPKGKIDSIFEPFKQGDSSIIRKHGGTGLGLPISRKLARLMGGDVTAKKGVKKGAAFTITLPLKNHQPSQASQLVRKDLTDLNEAIRNELTSNTRLLVAEDYPGNVVVLSQLLEDLNIPFDVAEDGAQAIDMWQKNYYDMILMDVQMPNVDGFSATQYIRAEEGNNKRARTPIIGMTAHALIGDKQRCIKVGMDAYLPKPLDEAALKKQLLKYLKKSAASQKVRVS